MVDNMSFVSKSSRPVIPYQYHMELAFVIYYEK